MRLTYWIHQILKYIFNGNIHYEFFTEVVSIGLVKRRVNFILSAPLIWCFMFTVKGPFTFDLNALYTSGTHVKPEIGSLSSFHKTFLLSKSRLEDVFNRSKHQTEMTLLLCQREMKTYDMKRCMCPFCCCSMCCIGHVTIGLPNK